MSDHALSVVALIVSIASTALTAIGTAWAVIRHCRSDDVKRGEDRARLVILERRAGIGE